MNPSPFDPPVPPRSRTGKRFRRSAMVTVAGVSALLLAACSGGSAASDEPADGAAGTADIEAAKSLIASLKEVPEFAAAGDPVDVAGLRGKTIFNIPISSEIPFDQAIGESMRSIAEEVGVTFTTFENRGQPSEWVRGLDLAVAEKPDLIMLQGAPDPEVLQPQLRQAADAGIPVLMTHQYPNGRPTPEGVTAHVTGPFEEAAQAEVAYAIAESGEQANLLVLTSDEVPVTPDIVAAIDAAAAEFCPSCSVKKVNVPIASWAVKIQTEVQSALIADPTVNWVVPTFDGMTQFAAAGIISTGRDDVRIATFNGTPNVLQMIQDADVVAMDAGENPDWLGHANMDAAFRLLAGMPDVVQTTPIRVFDDENVSEAGTPPTLGVGYGDAYVSGYRKLWGLS